MRWRSPSKPRCRFAKLVSDHHRVRQSLTGQEQSAYMTLSAKKQPLTKHRMTHSICRDFILRRVLPSVPS